MLIWPLINHRSNHSKTCSFSVTNANHACLRRCRQHANVALRIAYISLCTRLSNELLWSNSYLCHFIYVFHGPKQTEKTPFGIKRRVLFSCMHFTICVCRLHIQPYAGEREVGIFRSTEVSIVVIVEAFFPQSSVAFTAHQRASPRAMQTVPSKLLMFSYGSEFQRFSFIVATKLCTLHYPQGVIFTEAWKQMQNRFRGFVVYMCRTFVSRRLWRNNLQTYSAFTSHEDVA